MKNIIKSIVVAIMIAVSFTSCEKVNEDPMQNPSEEPTEIPVDPENGVYYVDTTEIVHTSFYYDTVNYEYQIDLSGEYSIHNVEWSFYSEANPYVIVKYKIDTWKSARYMMQPIYNNVGVVIGHRRSMVELYDTWTETSIAEAYYFPNMSVVVNNVIRLDNIKPFVRPTGSYSQPNMMFYPYDNAVPPYMFVEIYYNETPNVVRHTDICWTYDISENIVSQWNTLYDTIYQWLYEKYLR